MRNINQNVKEEYDIIPKAVTERPCLGFPEAVRLAMHEPPHLRSVDVDKLGQEIEKGKLPINQEGIFDEVKS